MKLHQIIAIDNEAPGNFNTIQGFGHTFEEAIEDLRHNLQKEVRETYDEEEDEETREELLQDAQNDLPKALCDLEYFEFEYYTFELGVKESIKLISKGDIEDLYDGPKTTKQPSK